MLVLALLALASRARAQATGEVFVLTDKPGARVLLDGMDTGRVTPAMLEGVSSGAHMVAARTACAAGEAAVTVAPGAIARAELRLDMAPGTLQVTATPPGATVTVDGAAVGAAPWVGDGLTCGEHTVTVEAPDHASQTRRVIVVAQESIAIDAVLVRLEYGMLVLDVMPLDAGIRLDGADLGPGPRTVDRVPVGRHEIDVSLAKYKPGHQVVDLARDATERVVVHLEPAPVPRKLPAARLAVDSGVTALAIGAGVGAAIVYGQASAFYETFLFASDDDEAERIFDEEVQPRQTLAAVLAIGSGLALGTAGVLWFTTDLDGDAVAGVSGTF